jgi:calcineurin-like phosphoesterase family protein/hemolysin type calcium-binding protein
LSTSASRDADTIRGTLRVGKGTKGRVRPFVAALIAGLIVAIPASAKTVVGTNGPDVLRGSERSDKLYGKGGHDRLYGLGGNDLLVGGPGRDLLEGADGNDRLLTRDGIQDTVRCGPGRDTAVVDVRDRVHTNCESILRPAPTPQTFVIAGAGDIATRRSDDDETALLIGKIDPDVVFTTGDNAYPDGSLADFETYYHPTWGRFKERTRPVPGNHDYHVLGASGYFTYFGSRAPGPYYAYNLGSWHLIALNSEISMEAGSPQYEWLEKDLATSNARCTLAYWHRPRYTSGRYDDFRTTTPLWQLLYAEGAELVLNGHDHNYQRFRPMDTNGQLDTGRGIREIVVGTGGAGLYSLRSDSRREAAQARVNGVLEVTLRADGYDWTFHPVSGTFRDSGSSACR